MGGRGSSSNLSGVPKNKKKSLESYRKRIKEHEEKIKHAQSTGVNTRTIHHWQKEIEAFKRDIEKIERRYRK